MHGREPHGPNGRLNGRLLMFFRHWLCNAMTGNTKAALFDNIKTLFDLENELRETVGRGNALRGYEARWHLAELRRQLNVFFEAKASQTTLGPKPSRDPF